MATVTEQPFIAGTIYRPRWNLLDAPLAKVKAKYRKKAKAR